MAEVQTSVSIKLPDNSVKELPAPATGNDLAQSIGAGLARAALAVEINGKVRDLAVVLEDDSAVRIITKRDPEGLELVRHSTAHMMAQAIRRLWPETKITIGPVIEDGFYYDFDSEHKFSPDDFEKIEAEMKKIVKEDLSISRLNITREEAIARWEKEGEIYKVEIAQDIPEGEIISLYEQGEFTDLCRGPHVPSTGRLGTFKILKVAGAYWRGDEKREMLQRVYATAFHTKPELEDHINLLQEAAKRDHRILGRQLNLFSLHEEAGSGLAYWHPRGARIRHVMESFWKEEHYKNGYELLYSPHVGKSWLWETSGHLDFYKENMYAPMSIDNVDHYGPMFFPVLADIFQFKTLRQIKIHLNRRALPNPLQRIPNFQINFWTIKSPFALIKLVIQIH